MRHFLLYGCSFKAMTSIAEQKAFTGQYAFLWYACTWITEFEYIGNTLILRIIWTYFFLYFQLSDEMASLNGSQATTPTDGIVAQANGRPKRQRRIRVPDKPNYPINLWSIMKNCIGKELSKIPMPVSCLLSEWEEWKEFDSIINLFFPFMILLLKLLIIYLHHCSF